MLNALPSWKTLSAEYQG